MTDYDDTNRGSIWPNDRKESERHPDFTGSLNVEGREFWVSAWKRAPDANPKAPSLRFSVKAKDEKPAENPSQATDFEDDIPF
jgi:hypothetical protein